VANSFSVLMPIRVESDSGTSLFFVDPIAQKAFKYDGSLATESETEEIMILIRGEQENYMPQIPYEQIYEVMDTERKIEEENNKHIFRRN